MLHFTNCNNVCNFYMATLVVTNHQHIYDDCHSRVANNWTVSSNALPSTAEHQFISKIKIRL